MSIKIFAAEHEHRHKGALQEIRKIKNDKFDGEIWVVAGFSKPEDKVKMIYDKILEIIKNTFFDLEISDPFERLEETLKKVNEAIGDDVKQLDEHAFRDGGFLIALFTDNVLHFTLCGTPEIYFIRKGRFTTVSEGISEQTKAGEIFTNIASGELKDDDKIIFTTIRLLRLVTGNQIAEAINGGVLESLETMKYILPKEEAASLVILHVKQSNALPFRQTDRKGFFADITQSTPIVEEESEIILKIKDLFYRVFHSHYSSKKIAIIFTSIIFLVIVASFIGSLANRQQDDQLEQYRNDIQQIRQDLSTVEENKLQGKNTEANLLIEKIETTAREIEQAGYFRQEVLDILETIEHMRDDINNITRISGANIVVDLKSIQNDIDLRGIFAFNGEQLVFSRDKIYLILSASGEIKSTYDIPQGEEIIGGAALSVLNKMVFLTKSGKIIEIFNDQVKYSTTTDEIFKNAVSIATYARFMYLLDPASNQIWKYENRDSGFGGAQEYNLDGSIENALDFAIDGNIFVVNKEGQIIKLFKGNATPYEFKDFPEENLQGISKIFTSEELDKIVLLDQVQNKLLVFTKGANESYYKSQIVIENTSQIRDFWVDANTNRLYIIDQSKIYRVGL